MKLLVFLLLPFSLIAQSHFTDSEIGRWEKQAQKVTIFRDHFGIPHIYGQTDADAVFGLLYAQCEDDFARVEMNYIEKLGRMAEVTGENDLYNDLLIRMIIDSAEAVRDFQKAPTWMKKLCQSFADGINFYLYTHPQVKPALLYRFEPWFPFLWTDGSIGAINTADINVNELKSLYGGGPMAIAPPEPTEEILSGSNGFAFAPSVTTSGNSILYINPHVTFYFRPEVHMVSQEGLNAYGAVTWGQFFIYQGFNEHCGWMHTSSYVDAADTYIEKISSEGIGFSYSYNGKNRPVSQKLIRLNYKSASGIQTKKINALYTHHGPIMAKRKDQFLSLRADNRITNGLIQCWQRTKATGLESFKRTLDLKGNISNNTVYADAAGNIAYWHGNRIPKRNPNLDWTQPVDGSTSETEWMGLHPIDETVHSINPPNGWLQNCNSTPFTVAGANSPKKENFPAYMAPDGENFRGINAVRVLGEKSGYTLEDVIKAGYDTRLAAFEVLVPALIKAFETNITPNDSLFAHLAGPIQVLKHWDFRSGEHSIATTLAVEWGQRLLPAIFRTNLIADDEENQVTRFRRFAETASADALLRPLLETLRDLEKRFGQWQMSWGSINRFQRISPNINSVFDDKQPSIPVGFASSTWGQLPSYSSRTYPGTEKRYGVHGNSFICAVEFIRNAAPGEKKIRAKSLLAGGESGDPSSPHFFDQAGMYAKGTFKEVLFYKEDVEKAAKRKYHPGEN
ncbi:MAG: penicillin acylase family protein [Chitinophagaceae bacterium]|nr:penicillin acylase family protein [Chitinophagaceae bacterium]